MDSRNKDVKLLGTGYQSTGQTNTSYDSTHLGGASFNSMKVSQMSGDSIIGTFEHVQKPIDAQSWEIVNLLSDDRPVSKTNPAGTTSTPGLHSSLSDSQIGKDYVHVSTGSYGGEEDPEDGSEKLPLSRSSSSASIVTLSDFEEVEDSGAVMPVDYNDVTNLKIFERHQIDIKKQEEEIGQLRDQLGAERGRNKQLEQRVAELEEERQEDEKILGEIRRNADQLCRQNTDNLESIRDQNRRLQQVIHSLKAREARIQEMKREFAKREADAEVRLINQEQQFRDRVEKYSNDLAKAKYHDFTKQEKIESLERRFEEFKKERSRLNAELRDVHAYYKKRVQGIEEDKRQLNKVVDSQIRKLSREKGEVSQDRDSLVEKLDNTHQQMAELRKEFDLKVRRLEQEKAELDAEKQEMSSQIMQLKNNLSEARFDKSGQDARIERLESEFEKSVEEQMLLERALKTEKDRTNQLAKRILDTEQALEQKKAELQNAVVAKLDVEEDLRDEKDRKNQLAKRVLDTEQALEQKKAELQNAVVAKLDVEEDLRDEKDRKNQLAKRVLDTEQALEQKKAELQNAVVAKLDVEEDLRDEKDRKNQLAKRVLDTEQALEQKKAELQNAVVAKLDVEEDLRDEKDRKNQLAKRVLDTEQALEQKKTELQNAMLSKRDFEEDLRDERAQKSVLANRLRKAEQVVCQFQRANLSLEGKCKQQAAEIQRLLKRNASLVKGEANLKRSLQKRDNNIQHLMNQQAGIKRQNKQLKKQLHNHKCGDYLARLQKRELVRNRSQERASRVTQFIVKNENILFRQHKPKLTLIDIQARQKTARKRIEVSQQQVYRARPVMQHQAEPQQANNRGYIPSTGYETTQVSFKQRPTVCMHIHYSPVFVPYIPVIIAPVWVYTPVVIYPVYYGGFYQVI